jgi:hypothetical protein
MAPTNKDSGVTRMAGAPMFKAVQHPELDTLGLVAVRDFLKKRARYLRLVAQNNKADGVNVTPITVVASIDPELLKNPHRHGNDRCGFWWMTAPTRV